MNRVHGKKIQEVTDEGKIVTRPVRGGAKLYLPEDAPSKSKGVLNKILEEGDSGKDQEGVEKKFLKILGLYNSILLQS